MKISYTKSAEKELLKLDKNLAIRIHKKISLLGNNPYGYGSQKLEVEQGFRIRIGDYRVIYFIDKDKKEIVIIKIRNRKEAYKK